MGSNKHDSDRKKQAKGIVDASGELLSNPLKMVKTPEPQPKEIIHMNIIGERQDCNEDDQKSDK